MVLGPGRQLAVAKRPQLAAQRRLGNRHGELIPQPLHQIDDPPADHAIDRRYRAALERFHKRRAMRGCGSAWKKGSDSLSLIFGGGVVLFSKGNQQHDEEFGRFVPDAGRSGH